MTTPTRRVSKDERFGALGFEGVVERCDLADAAGWCVPPHGLRRCFAHAPLVSRV